MNRLGLGFGIAMAVVFLVLAIGCPASQARWIATDPSGDLYNIWSPYAVLERFSPDGALVSKREIWVTEKEEPRATNAVATDPSGNVYVAEGPSESYFSEPTRIRKFSPSGAFVTTWGSQGTGAGQFEFPSDVATDAAGNVYVADAHNNRVQKFTGGGAFVASWPLPFASLVSLMSLDIDAGGDVYVADAWNDRVIKLASDGTFLNEWGGEGEADGQFESPSDITVNDVGDVYVTDLFNHRVQEFTSGGAFIRAWGSYGAGKGQFEEPEGIDVDAAGNVYVYDWQRDPYKGYFGVIKVFKGDGTFVTEWLTEPPSVEEPPPPLDRPTITAGPRPTTGSRSAELAFASGQSGVGFECRLGGQGVAAALAQWSPCSSPRRYSHLAPGQKRFSVRVVEGTRRSAAATREWTILKAGVAKPVILPVARRTAFFHATCPLAERCRERVVVKAGSKGLARGRYSVPAGADKHIKIPLTGTGQRVIARRSQVSATLRIENLRTHKSAEVAVLLVRR